MNLKKECLIRLGRHEDVVVWCNKILALDPNDNVATHDKGVAQMKAGRPQEAVKTLERGLKAMPTQLPMLESLKEAYKQLQKDDLVVQTCDRIVAVDQNNKAAYFDKAVALDRTEKYDECQAAYRLALKHDPTNPEVFYNIAALFLRIGKPREAVDYAKQGLIVPLPLAH
jgi:tetratricopeptide (TPR) repeat protein